jgi:hypothetical protein
MARLITHTQSARVVRLHAVIGNDFTKIQVAAIKTIKSHKEGELAIVFTIIHCPISAPSRALFPGCNVGFLFV